MKTPILKMTNIVKEFPGVKALDGVNIELHEGKVMALMGENGAGKSTLMKILSGVYKKDGGEIFYQGKKEDIKVPKDATKKGIAIIHQELNLVNDLSIGENIFLGREPKKGFKIDFNKLHSDSEVLLKRLNIDKSSRELVKNLSIGEKQMIEMMVGRKLTDQFPRLEVEKGETILKLENVSNKFVNSISFEVKSGEILGIAGLMGAGRSELAKTIYGHYPIVSGTMIKKDMKLNKYLQMNLKSSVDGIKNRIAYVSEDRKGDGLILDLSIRENMTLSSLERISNSFIIDKNKEKERVNSYIDRIRIKTPSIEQLIKNLSGGNQQKVAIAKALMIHPDVLILDEPTRGVDVGAKKEIYDLINEFKAQGKAIIMISSEMPELLGLSDRVLVLSHGQITGEFDIKDATQEKILKCAVNIKEDNRDVISGKTTA